MTYKKLKKNKSLNSGLKKNLNFFSKKSVQFAFFRERKKNYHNLFGWKKNILYYNNGFLLVSNYSKFKKLLFNRQKDTWYFFSKITFLRTNPTIIETIKKKQIILLMYKIRNNFLINQNLSIILLRSVDIYHKYLYFYMFSVKRLIQWSKVNRMLVLNSKYKHILLSRLYFVDTHEFEFLRLSILEVHLNTFKFNYFFKGIFLTKLQRDYLIENKSCLFSFNNDKQLIILSFFKNYYKLIRDYGESLLSKDIFLISKSSLFFFARKNEWNVLKLRRFKLNRSHNFIISSFENLFLIKEHSIFNSYIKLNNFLIAGLIFRRNFTKTTIKIKKKFYFFEKKLEFLKNQTLYLKRFRRLKTLNRLDFTTFLYLRQNILLTTSLGFLFKTNLSLEFLVIKMINGLTFHNLFLDYQKSIQNQLSIIKLKDFFLIENDLVKRLNFKQSICYINQYRQCLIKFRLKSKKVKDKKIIKKIQTIRAFYKKKLEVLKTINFSRLNAFLNVIKEQFKRKTRLALKNRKSLLKNQKLSLKKNLKKNS